VAEDNIVNQRVAMAVLERMGHQATIAANGEEALCQWRDGQFDVVFMDVQMPGMDGFEASRHSQGGVFHCQAHADYRDDCSRHERRSRAFA